MTVAKHALLFFLHTQAAYAAGSTMRRAKESHNGMIISSDAEAFEVDTQKHSRLAGANCTTLQCPEGYKNATNKNDKFCGLPTCAETDYAVCCEKLPEWFYPATYGVECEAPAWAPKYDCRHSIIQASGAPGKYPYYFTPKYGTKGDKQVEMYFSFPKVYNLSGFRLQCASGIQFCLCEFRIQKKNFPDDPWEDVFHGTAEWTEETQNEYTPGNSFEWTETTETAARYWNLVMLSSNGDNKWGGVAIQNMQFQGREGQVASCTTLQCPEGYKNATNKSDKFCALPTCAETDYAVCCEKIVQWFYPATYGVECEATYWPKYDCQKSIMEASGKPGRYPYYFTARDQGVNDDNQTEMNFSFPTIYNLSGWRQQCAYGLGFCLKDFRIQKRNSPGDPWEDVFHGTAQWTEETQHEYTAGNSFEWTETTARYWNLVMLSNNGDTRWGGAVAIQNMQFLGCPTEMEEGVDEEEEERREEEAVPELIRTRTPPVS